MKRLALVILAIMALAAQAEAGEERPLAVVELFTSQGCSSCPPADEYLGELARREDLIALAWHVDYWDYLGWKDTLGDKSYTARQDGYRKALGKRSKYTPQMIINGRVDAIGSHRHAVENAIAATKETLTIPVTMKHSGNILTINVSQAAGKIDADLKLACYDAPQKVPVKRGENRGRDIVYWNAVSSWQTLGMWHGEAAQVDVPLSAVSKTSGGCVALIQEMIGDGQPGLIRGAAKITF